MLIYNSTHHIIQIYFVLFFPILPLSLRASVFRLNSMWRNSEIVLGILSLPKIHVLQLAKILVFFWFSIKKIWIGCNVPNSAYYKQWDRNTWNMEKASWLLNTWTEDPSNSSHPFWNETSIFFSRLPLSINCCIANK